MIKNKQLTILSETENFAFYELPDFNNKQRREYFSFSENEILLIMRSNHAHINIYCALQIAYFKAKKMFFQFSLEELQEDVQFVLHNYFPKYSTDAKIIETAITKHEYYTQRRAIANLFGYQLWSQKFLPLVQEQADLIIKHDITPNFIARELIAFLSDIKIVRPAYTTLQTIVSKTLSNERKRISGILDLALSKEDKHQLDQLMISEDTLSKLAGFKQDAKNFGFKMMLKEREKHGILESFYNIAKCVIPKLDISKQNVDTYANLAIYYTTSNLRKLQYNQNYLYILCYVLKRYHQLNDNLVEAFTYHVKKFEKTTKEKVDTYFVEETTESQEKIGNLLLLYVDDKQFNDTSPFSQVRNQAFKIMPKENILVLGKQMINKPHLRKEFKWKEIDKSQRSYKKILRPLFMKLDFSSESLNNPWLKAANWLQKVFAKHQKLSDRPFEYPAGTIPKHLERYLTKNINRKNKTIIDNRYEYHVYCQINKKLSNGELYIDNSLNYRCFNHELVTLNKKEEIFKKLNIPWLQNPIDKQISALSKELHDLWVLFNKNLKQDNLAHLKYDAKKQKLYWHKIKANRNEKLQSKFFKQLPICEISDVLNFVNDDCHFLSAFVPLQPRYAKQNLADKDKLIATILAQAFNHGNYKMSQISDVSYRSLETTYQQYLRLSTLNEAINIMSNAILKLKVFPYYSLDLELLYSSVDGQKFELDTPNIKARHSRKYLREGQGVSAYTILANHIPLHSELIGSHEHESYYAFDIWYNNTSEIIPEVITGDMHVINKANFAIMKWFGVELNPRFTNLHDQLKNLFCASNIKKYKNFLIKPVSQIDLQIIFEQKSSIDQLVATLALKEMNQANLIKKLCHLPIESNLRKAVFEYDKLIRSIYTLKYLMDVKLQKTVHKSQNRIESYHQLRAAIAKVGGKKQLYGKTDIDIEISNQCGRLVALAIIYYNSIILSAVLEKYPELINNKRFLAMLQKISPVAWHYHIHFLGQYTFQNKDHTIDINQILKKINLSY